MFPKIRVITGMTKIVVNIATMGKYGSYPKALVIGYTVT